MVRNSQSSPSTSLINRNSELNSENNNKKKMKFGKSAKLSIQLVLTFGYFLCEIVVGYQNSAMSLVADSFHMLSDVQRVLIMSEIVERQKREKFVLKFPRNF